MEETGMYQLQKQRHQLFLNDFLDILDLLRITLNNVHLRSVSDIPFFE